MTLRLLVADWRCAAIAAALLVGACSGSPDRDAYAEVPKGSKADDLAATIVANTVGAEGRAAARKGLPVAAPARRGDARLLPTAMQGGWGLTPDDCTLGRGGNPGLMMIEGDVVRFYEARARVDVLEHRSPSRVVADLTFTGEGGRSKRRTTFALALGGTRLDRIEQSPAGTVRYERC